MDDWLPCARMVLHSSIFPPRAQHIALAIGEEVDLQTRLLDDLQDEVDTTHMRMRAATSRVKKIIASSSTWKGGFCIFVLIVALVVVLLLVLKINHLFGG